MHWEVQYPEPKEPKPRPFDFYDVITCLGFAYSYTMSIASLSIVLFIITELLWGWFQKERVKR